MGVGGGGVLAAVFGVGGRAGIESIHQTTIKSKIMKKLSCFILAVLVFSTVFGQVEKVIFNSYEWDYAYKMAWTSSNNAVLLHGSNEYAAETMTVLDTLNTTVFRLTTDGLSNASQGRSFAEFTDVVEMPNQTLAAFTDGWVVDLNTGDAFMCSAILQLNQAGDVENDIYCLSITRSRGASFSDGNYLAMDAYSPFLLGVSTDLGSQWVKAFPGFNFHDVAVSMSDSILLATAQGLLVLTKDFTIASEYPSFKFDRIKPNGQNGVIGVRGDSLFQLSPGYSVLAVAIYPGDTIKDFDVRDGRIAVLTNSNMVYQYGDSLSVLDSFQLADIAEFKFIAIGPIRLMLSGLEKYGGGLSEFSSTKAAFLKAYSFGGDSYGLSNDVGIVGIDQGSDATILPAGSGYFVNYYGTKVTVRNYGDNPVETLYLHAYRNNPKQFTNLSLQPGEDVELEWAEYRIYFNTYPTPGQVADNCIWPSHPDYRLDTDFTNDTYCAEFVVGSREAVPTGSFSIYPNPTAGESTLLYRLPVGQDGEVRIYDSVGRTVGAYPVAGSDGALQLPSLPSGVYGVYLTAEGRVVARGRWVSL